MSESASHTQKKGASASESLEADVLVIGAGPAGSSAAAILAEAGHRVVGLERERFPRYAVGESLIPCCWYPLDRLGLVEVMDESPFIVHKHSVQFVSTGGELSQPFYFFEHTDHASARTWQVVRSEFDQLLLGNARCHGAEFFEETPAKELLWEGERVVGARARRADGSEFEVRARLTIDASGRAAFSQARNRWRIPDEKLRKVAVWSYIEGAKRCPGKDEGATTIAYLPEKGWFWYLPLANDVVSVGVVAEADYLFREGRDLEEVFERETQAQPWIHDRIRGGRRIEDVRATSEFTYRSRYCATDGLVLTGDALGFLDPVFSSGVYFALQGGVAVADAAIEAFRANDLSAERFAEYGANSSNGMEAMRALVHAFYEEDFNFGDFLKRYPHHRADVTDILIGRLDRDFEPFFQALSEFANLPERLPHGKALVPGSA